jgi:antitoxin VapB
MPPPASSKRITTAPRRRSGNASQQTGSAVLGALFTRCPLFGPAIRLTGGQVGSRPTDSVLIFTLADGGLKSTPICRISNVDILSGADMLTRTLLFLSNRSQAVRLPKAVAFDENVREVVIVPDGPRRIIAPAEAAWDDFFDAPGIDLGAREQPAMQERERF